MPQPQIIYQHRIYRANLRNNPAIIYVFGDNEIRQGLGGQAAEMRGEANAHGIATLKAPGHPWSDDDFEANCEVINVDLATLFARAPAIVVFPSDGIGTGLALLKESAPQTYDYLNTQLLDLFGIRNGGST